MFSCFLYNCVRFVSILMQINRLKHLLKVWLHLTPLSKKPRLQTMQSWLQTFNMITHNYKTFLALHHHDNRSAYSLLHLHCHHYQAAEISAVCFRLLRQLYCSTAGHMSARNRRICEARCNKLQHVCTSTSFSKPCSKVSELVRPALVLTVTFNKNQSLSLMLTDYDWWKR